MLETQWRWLSTVNGTLGPEGSVLDNVYYAPHLLRRYRRRFRSPRVPIAKRSAIHLTVIVVSAHKRAAMPPSMDPPWAEF